MKWDINDVRFVDYTLVFQNQDAHVARQYLEQNQGAKKNNGIH